MKRSWGNATLKYDEEKKVFWSITKTGRLIKYFGLPTYGIERKSLPERKS